MDVLLPRQGVHLPYIFSIAILEHAGNAALNFSPFKCHLAEANVVEGFNAFGVGVNLGFVNIACRGCIREEQCERKPLVYMLSGNSIRVHDGFVA